MPIAINTVHPDGYKPHRAHHLDAGADLRAHRMVIDESTAIVTYYTGVYVQLPSGTYGAIHPRSSIYKTKLIMCNAPGTIDAGYRGEVIVKFRMLPGATEKDIYQLGDKIAQLLVVPLVPDVDFVSKIALDPVPAGNTRGSGGFGSTGA